MLLLVSQLSYIGSSNKSLKTYDTPMSFEDVSEQKLTLEATIDNNIQTLSNPQNSDIEKSADAAGSEEESLSIIEENNKEEEEDENYCATQNLSVNYGKLSPSFKRSTRQHSSGRKKKFSIDDVMKDLCHLHVVNPSKKKLERTVCDDEDEIFTFKHTLKRIKPLSARKDYTVENSNRLHSQLFTERKTFNPFTREFQDQENQAPVNGSQNSVSKNSEELVKKSIADIAEVSKYLN